MKSSKIINLLSLFLSIFLCLNIYSQDTRDQIYLKFNQKVEIYLEEHGVFAKVLSERYDSLIVKIDRKGLINESHHIFLLYPDSSVQHILIGLSDSVLNDISESQRNNGNLTIQQRTFNICKSCMWYILYHPYYNMWHYHKVSDCFEEGDDLYIKFHNFIHS